MAFLFGHQCISSRVNYQGKLLHYQIRHMIATRGGKLGLFTYFSLRLALPQTGITRNGARSVVFLFAVSVFHYDRSVVSTVSTHNFDLRVKLEYDTKCLLI